MADEGGRFAYEGLDRVIHERARLGILSSLATSGEGLSFNDLKDLCTLTDGNLCRHLRVLEEAGIVETRKHHALQRAQTTCRMTAAGRRRFLEYLGVLEEVIANAELRTRRKRDPLPWDARRLAPERS